MESRTLNGTQAKLNTHCLLTIYACQIKFKSLSTQIFFRFLQDPVIKTSIFYKTKFHIFTLLLLHQHLRQINKIINFIQLEKTFFRVSIFIIPFSWFSDFFCCIFLEFDAPRKYILRVEKQQGMVGLNKKQTIIVMLLQQNTNYDSGD